MVTLKWSALLPWFYLEDNGTERGSLHKSYTMLITLKKCKGGDNRCNN